MRKKCMLTFLLVIISADVFHETLDAQNVPDTPASDTLKQKTCNSNQQVTVNLEMIRRFREVKTEGDIYSWSQLLINRDSRAIQAYLQSYGSSDLNSQSLAGVQLALEETIKETAPAEDGQEDEYYANIRRIKQEISFRLRSDNPVALK